jgi:anti-anti-sigma factor
MDVKVETLGHRQIVHLNNKITVEHCPALESRLNALHGEKAQLIVLDFKNVPFLDSSGIELIVRFLKRLRDENRGYEVINANGRVLDLFRLYRLESFMKLEAE